jgi:hypothetical protein
MNAIVTSESFVFSTTRLMTKEVLGFKGEEDLLWSASLKEETLKDLLLRALIEGEIYKAYEEGVPLL